ncbi:oligoribonuclease [Pedobacter sp.]|nr:oligoribonuclease [Candidatus Saccharibacteria bacterium]
MITTDASFERLLWIDLEMTGLAAGNDVIVEVAAIVTDWDFNEIAHFESGVGHPADRVQALLDANPWYSYKMKENKTAMITLSAQSAPSTVIEQQLIEFVKKYCDTHRPVLLAGNSIHIDRQFIHAEWPFFEQLLHYRMLDVTAWKLVFEAKYGTKGEKREEHRALGDVRESIAELRQYLERVS